MKLEFANGNVIDVIKISEEKLIHSVPKKWKIEITSSTDLSSNELDELLTEENILQMVLVKEDGFAFDIVGYNYVAKVIRTVDDNGAILTIFLQKELLNDED